MMRVLVTLACVAVFVGMAFVPAPGGPLEAVDDISPWQPVLSLGILGVAPLIGGALLVELASLLHPKTRAMRIGGREARAGLRRAALVLALALAALQAHILWTWIDADPLFFDEVAMEKGPWREALFVVSAVGATALTAVLVETMTRHGLGNGMSMLLAAQVLFRAAFPLVDTLRTLDDRIHGVDWLGVAAVSAVLGYVTLLVLRRRTVRDGAGPPVHIPAPASGLAPIEAASVVYFIVRFDFLPETLVVDAPALPPLDAPYYWDVFVPTAVVLTAAFTVLFYRTSAVVSCWIAYEREASRTAVIASTIRARWRALSWTVPFILGIAIADTWLATETLGVSALAIVVLTVIGRDIVATLRFESAHGDVASIEEVHRLYLLPIVLEELARAGIPAHARNANHRTLLQFFGPYIPVEILVPAKQAAKATAILGARMRSESPDHGL